MLDVRDFKAGDLSGLSHSEVTALAEQMLSHIGEQSKELERRARDIKFKDVKLERITFELARLKAWKFGAKTERMSAEQRHLFEEALAEDQASLEAQLAALLGEARHKAANADSDADEEKTKRPPRRQALPEHLRRVEYQHEPESTTCPSPGCGQAMVRIGEDITEKLDIVPAEFFVHHHVRGKWACRCCQVLVQPPVEPQVIDKGMPAAGSSLTHW